MQENKTQCWLCEEIIEYKGEKYRDVTCPKCQVLNSVYNPEQKEEEEMKPIRKTTEFEKVVIGEMIKGVISEVMYDQEHKFKGYQGAEDTIQPAVRFKFELEGYKFPHYSRWFKFNYGERANLYKIFLSKLVEKPKPDMDFDLDLLKGMKIKTIWNENGDFQNLESIFPLEGKVKATDTLSPEEPADEDTSQEERLTEDEEL